MVELAIAIVTFGFVATGLSLLFLSLQDIQRQSAYLESANQIARTEVESLRNNNYTQLVDGQIIDFSSNLPSTLPAPRSGTAQVSEPVAGIKRVDVTVSYTDKGSQRQVELSSLIGVIGISQ